MDSGYLCDATRPTDAVDTTPQGVLAVQGIDFCIDTNGENHHTSKFDLMIRSDDKCLVVRRGQAFKLDILLNRPYDASKDTVSFIFSVVDEDTCERSAAVPLLKKGSEKLDAWTVTYESQVDSHVIVAVTPAANCIVAPWKLHVNTKLGEGSPLNYGPFSFYVLFNPWCQADSVYMPGPSQRNEFVLEDNGLIFKGFYNQIGYITWNYAQYEKDILGCALYLVREIGKVKGRARGDPIRTSRALSAAVNAEDDNGVIIGNWSQDKSDYSDGTHPNDWDGSLAILQKYYEKKIPIKYGQCWVYAGVLTTICRALGIPCRPVSCYESGVDTQGSLTVDYYEDDKGNRLNNPENGDSVWNFHVWNEVWMDRSDLGPEYGGWQVLDSTPQQTSENIFCCGPASLKAIKKGELQKPYDAAYVFAEVNADEVTWNDSNEVRSRDTAAIGQNISTKAIGKMKRDDITITYKYPERTRKERMTMEKTLRNSESIISGYYLNDPFNDITFDLEQLDDIKIGQNCNVVLHIRNISSSNSHQIKGKLEVVKVSHNVSPGITAEHVKSSEFDLNLQPEGQEVIRMLVTFDDYHKKLVDKEFFIYIICSAKIVDRKIDFSVRDLFKVRDPDIKISIDGKPMLRQEFTVNIKVENTLPIPLTNCKFYIQGPGLEKQLIILLDANVAPGEFATAQYKLKPPSAGRHQISAKFTSKEIHDVNGILTIEVTSPSETNGVPANAAESH